MKHFVFAETYVNRVTRSVESANRDEPQLDIVEVEKRLIAEFGENVCVYERVCAKYAEMKLRSEAAHVDLDWDFVFR